MPPWPGAVRGRAVDVVGFDGTLQVLGHHDSTRVPGEAPPSVEGSSTTANMPPPIGSPS